MGTALSSQWARLLGGQAGAGTSSTDARVVAWHVRAADSEWVSRVWLGAQNEAGLSAPAIAVDGSEGWLVCFALPPTPLQADAVEVLRERIRAWLNQGDATVSAQEAATWRFTCWPQALPADGVPVPRQVGPDRWSAFVAPDLVPVFAESPWLDCAPGEEGQAALLSRLQPIPAADWGRLRAKSAQAASGQADAGVGNEAVGARETSGHPMGGEATPVGTVPTGDPRAFLLSVMNDPGVELPLRIEAARVLLAHG